jgi:hypothetical protein
MCSREEIAIRHGFETIAELVEHSNPLPLLPGDSARSYVARRPDGTWFVWLEPIGTRRQSVPEAVATG